MCPVTSWPYWFTGDGLWIGNIYNFLSSVRGRIGADADQPLELDDDMHRIANTDVHKALREGLVNCLMHADYLGDLVVKIEKYPKNIIMMNSGLFRIPLNVAEKGGESAPRNTVIARMFSLIGLSERAGVGINFIMDTWERHFGNPPGISEDIVMQRTTVDFNLHSVQKMDPTDAKIMNMIKKDKKVTIEKMTEELGLSRPTVANHLKGLKSRGSVLRIGGTRGHWELNEYQD